VIKREIENVGFFFNARSMRRLRKDDNVALEAAAE
jgi:hypothetical protein